MIAEDINYVSWKAVFAKVGAICVNAVVVKVICPHRIECVTKALRKTQSHAPGSGEGVYQTETLAFTCKYAFRPRFVKALFFSDEPFMVHFP